MHKSAWNLWLPENLRLKQLKWEKETGKFWKGLATVLIIFNCGFWWLNVFKGDFLDVKRCKGIDIDSIRLGIEDWQLGIVSTVDHDFHNWSV